MSDNDQLPDDTSPVTPLPVPQGGLVGSHLTSGFSGPLEPAPVTATSAVNLTALAHAMRRRWLACTALGLFCAAIVAPLVWFGWGARYTAESFLRVYPRERMLVFENPENSLAATNTFDIYKETQKQLLKSRFVLTAAVRKPDVAGLPVIREEEQRGDAIAWLSSRLEVDYPGRAEIMRVALTGTDPKGIKTIVQAIVDAYLNEVVDVERKERRQRLNELDRVFAEKETEVRAKRNDLKRLAENLGTTDSETLSLKQQHAVSEFAEYQKELVQMQFRLLHIKGQLAAQEAFLQSVDQMRVSELEVEKFASANPTARQLVDLLALQEWQYRQARANTAPSGHDKYVKPYEENLQITRAQIEELNRSVREKVRDQKRADVEAEVQKLRAEKATLTEQEERFREDVDRKRKEIEHIGGRSVDIEMARAEIHQLGDVLTEIAKEREQLRVELRSVARIQLLQPAEDPRSEVGLSVRIALTFLATFVALVFPAFGVVLWDARANRINGASDVSHGLGLSVVGSIPKVPARIIRRLGAPTRQHQQWRMRLTESVDSIAARLLRNAEQRAARTLLITSAATGEGKTTLATQLAMSFARNGRRTVLVDFDLRRPALDAVFDMPLEPGVSEVLRGETELARAVHQTPTPNLAMITAGNWDRRALAALANGAAGALICQLRAQFDMVVIDSSPVLPVADTRFVSQHVDTVLLAVFRDISEAPKLTAACEILEAFGVRDLEAVMTGQIEHLRGKDLNYVSTQPA